MELFDDCFDVVLIPLLLASWGMFSFRKLGVEDLFWKANSGIRTM